MKRITASDIAEMPLIERIKLVEDIWDSIVEIPDAVEIPEWHKAALDKRLELYRKNPEIGSPWAEVKRRIFR